MNVPSYSANIATGGYSGDCINAEVIVARGNHTAPLLESIELKELQRLSALGKQSGNGVATDYTADSRKLHSHRHLSYNRTVKITTSLKD
jgi:hypothetical protein